jgi:hypothetical protein
MVELVGTFAGEAEPAEPPAAAAETAHAARPIATAPAPVVHGGPHPAAHEEPVGPQAGTNADGVRLAGQILRSATTARWPMYVRNVKQLLRAYRGDGLPGANGDGAPGGFDERRYGFGGLMDLLRACQREELVRVERDRRGGLRVFPGPALQRTGLPQAEAAPEPSEVQAIASEPVEAAEVDQVEMEPIPIDTTAELLGRAKPRRPRGRSTPTAVASSTPRGVRKAAARKPAVALRAPRAKKAARPGGADENES